MLNCACIMLHIAVVPLRLTNATPTVEKFVGPGSNRCNFVCSVLPGLPGGNSPNGSARAPLGFTSQSNGVVTSGSGMVTSGSGMVTSGKGMVTSGNEW